MCFKQITWLLTAADQIMQQVFAQVALEFKLTGRQIGWNMEVLKPQSQVNFKQV